VGKERLEFLGIASYHIHTLTIVRGDLGGKLREYVSLRTGRENWYLFSSKLASPALATSGRCTACMIMDIPVIHQDHKAKFISALQHGSARRTLLRIARCPHSFFERHRSEKVPPVCEWFWEIQMRLA
jgi:hypothetical protein